MKSRSVASTLGLSRVAAALADWYRTNARDLPFRKTRDPYRIWISEVMLQQTRVAAMVPAYERFLERFPDVDALAVAEESDVLYCWQGLGYYTRARNLHRTAKQVRAERTVESEQDSVFPSRYNDLIALPGVGPYTAAAIASIANEESVAVLDGNVRRVLSRLFFRHPEKSVESSETGQSPSEKDLIDLAGQFLREGRQLPSVHNQALMELGALICVPGLPLCRDCPVSGSCGAFREGGEAFAETIPPSRKQFKSVLDLDIQVHSLLARGVRKILLIPNEGGPFLKGHLFFPHRIRESGRETYRSPGFEVEHPPLPSGRVLRHAIMNWSLRCRVQEIIRDEAGIPFDGARWMSLPGAQAALVSSLGLKILRAIGSPSS